MNARRLVNPWTLLILFLLIALAATAAGVLIMDLPTHERTIEQWGPTGP